MGLIESDTSELDGPMGLEEPEEPEELEEPDDTGTGWLLEPGYITVGDGRRCVWPVMTLALINKRIQIQEDEQCCYSMGARNQMLPCTLVTHRTASSRLLFRRALAVIVFVSH